MRPRKQLSMLCVVQLVATIRQYEYYGGLSCGWSLIREVTDAKCSSVCNYYFGGGAWWPLAFSNSKLYLLSVFVDFVARSTVLHIIPLI